MPSRKRRRFEGRLPGDLLYVHIPTNFFAHPPHAARKWDELGKGELVVFVCDTPVVTSGAWASTIVLTRIGLRHVYNLDLREMTVVARGDKIRPDMV